jgi:hypothetical protein
MGENIGVMLRKGIVLSILANVAGDVEEDADCSMG